MALVAQADGAVLACTWRLVTVTALSRVKVEPIQVEVRAPGKKAFTIPRGLAERVSPPSLNLKVETPPPDRELLPAELTCGAPLPHPAPVSVNDEPETCGLEQPPATIRKELR